MYAWAALRSTSWKLPSRARARADGAGSCAAKDLDSGHRHHHGLLATSISLREHSNPLGLQDDLFASEATSPAFDTSFATAKRVALDEHSWVEVVPSWMSGSRFLFDRLSHA